MNFYVTTESDRKIKNAFTNLSTFYIINVDSIIEESNLDMTKPANKFLVGNEIKRLITIGAKSKRYNGIIYINSKIDKDAILSLKELFEDTEKISIDDFSLLDDYDLPKLNHLYKLFDEVIFFPAFKKTKIIKCTSLRKKDKNRNEQMATY